MNKRLLALKVQEESLAIVTREHQAVETEVQSLIEGTATQVEQFRSARLSVARFQKQIQRITGPSAPAGAPASTPAAGGGYEEEEKADKDEALTTAVSGAFGLFGSLLKAGAENLKSTAEASNKKRLPE